MANSPKLTDQARERLVCLLAAFETPSWIVGAIKKEFDVAITPQAVEAYDPTKFAGRKLAPRWTAIFWAAREAFLNDLASVAISQKIVRLRRLDRMSIVAEEKGNLLLASQLLEQAAKEMGEAYSNKRHLDAKFSTVSDARELTNEELMAIAMGER